MDHMLYVAMSGAKQTMLAQAANAHNLANVSTTGFKEDLLALQSWQIGGQGYPSRVNAVAGQTGTNLSPGTIMTTGGELDVAVSGEGWIAVQAADGSEAYTRAGDLRITETGNLINGAGHPVLGNGGPIAIPPAEKVEIGNDGTISVRPLGQAPSALVIVDRIKLVNPDPDQLTKGEDGLLRLEEGEIAAPNASARLISGSLETSNVNAIDAMVNMIALSRQFESQVKLMKVAEENDSVAARLMAIS